MRHCPKIIGRGAISATSEHPHAHHTGVYDGIGERKVPGFPGWVVSCRMRAHDPRMPGCFGVRTLAKGS